MEVVIICWLYESKASDVFSTLPVILYSIPIRVNEGLRQGRQFPLEWDFGKNVQTEEWWKSENELWPYLTSSCCLRRSSVCSISSWSTSSSYIAPCERWWQGMTIWVTLLKGSG